MASRSNEEKLREIQARADELNAMGAFAGPPPTPVPTTLAEIEEGNGSEVASGNAFANLHPIATLEELSERAERLVASCPACVVVILKRGDGGSCPPSIRPVFEDGFSDWQSVAPFLESDLRKSQVVAEVASNLSPDKIRILQQMGVAHGDSGKVRIIN